MIKEMIILYHMMILRVCRIMGMNQIQEQTPFLLVVPAGQAVTQASPVRTPEGQERKQIWLL
jgi:hypothetical protein